MATNKEIVERLNCIEARLPNGELEEIHTKIVDHLPEEFKEIWWRDYDKHRRLIKELQINKNKYG